MSMAPALLRPAGPADAQRIADVLIASRKAFLPFAPSVHSEAETRQWVRGVLLPTRQVTVALVDGVLVGVLAQATVDGCQWVEQLYVHPSHVGQGLGSLLLAQAIAGARLAVRLYTFQQNLGARRFYERHGFAAIALSDGSTNEEKCPDVLYERAAG